MLYPVKLTKQCIMECSGPGKVDSVVAHWVTVPRIKNQLDKIG